MATFFDGVAAVRNYLNGGGMMNGPALATVISGAGLTLIGAGAQDAGAAIDDLIAADAAVMQYPGPQDIVTAATGLVDPDAGQMN